MADQPETVDAYLAGFPSEVREILSEIRETVRRALPEATEAIRYGIPTFRLDGRNVVHFAGWKQFVGLYPIPDGDTAFDHAIEPCRASRGRCGSGSASPCRTT